MTEVFDLQVDFNGSTTSPLTCYGIYSSFEAADKAREKLKLEIWQQAYIVERKVLGINDV